MSESFHYDKRAIDVIFEVIGDTYKINELLRDMCKNQPSAVVHAAERLGFIPVGVSALGTRVIGIYTSQGKIPAIKAYREMTGKGLKDSKDAVERICSHLIRGVE